MSSLNNNETQQIAGGRKVEPVKIDASAKPADSKKIDSAKLGSVAGGGKVVDIGSQPAGGSGSPGGGVAQPTGKSVNTGL